MRPTNNRVYCIGCKHPKMLFETQTKADNFIKFNRDEIASSSEKVPARSYYCSFCCGWHVTSVEDEGKAEANDKRDEQTWHQIQSLNRKKIPLNHEGQKLSEMLVSVHTLLQKCLRQLFMTNLSDALNLYKDIVLDLSIIEDLARKQSIVSPRIDRIRAKVKALQNTFDMIDEYDIDSDTRMLFLSKDNLSHHDWTINYMLNKEFVEHINNQLSNLRQAQENNDIDECNRLYKEISETLNNYKGPGISAKRKELTDRFAKLSNWTPEKTLKETNTKNNNNSLYMSIINLLEQAHQAINHYDYKRCESLVKTAECLMPDSSDEVSQLLWCQIQGLRERL